MATFIIGGDADCPTVRVTTEPVDGDSLRITLEVIPTAGGITGDLIGFYFSVPDDVEGDLSVSDAVGGGNDPSNTFNLVAGNDNINAGPYPGFDYRLEIGTNGIGEDDIQTFSFTLNGVPDSSDLSWLQAMAARLTSVGVEGDRGDSCWLADITTVPDAIPGINIIKYTNGTDDVCPMILVGEDVVWTYEVTNAGNVPLGDIVVTDDQGVTPIAVDANADGFNDGDLDSDGLLDVGETWTYQATGTATAGDYANLGTVTGNYGDTEVTSSEDDCYFGAAPAVTIDKQINGYDDCFSILAGSPITYSFTVTNTGNVELTNLAVTDDVLGDIGLIGSLGVGESVVFDVDGVASEGEHHNTGTVAGTVSDDVGNSVDLSESDEACYEGAAPAIAIVKKTNGTDDTCPTILVGESVTWSYYVTNTGNVALSDVSVLDDSGTPADDTDDFAPTFVGGDTNADGKLDLDEIWEYTASGTAAAGEYANIASTAGAYTDDLGTSTTVESSEDDCYFGAAPAVTIDKQINGYDDCFSILAGSPITYSFTVTNTGNVELTDLTVTDDVLGDIGLIGNLGVGDSIVFEVAGTAEAGEHHNTGTVAGTVSDDVGNSVDLSESDEACYEGAAPAIAIVKKTNGTDDVCPDVQVGSTVTWSYYVTNTGNVALSDVSVLDDAGTPGDDTDDFAPTFVGGDTNADGKLDLNETWEYSASGEAILGDYSNIAYTQGSYTDDLGSSTTVYANEDDCYTGHACFEGLTPGFWRQTQNWGKVTLDPDCYDLLGGTSFAEVIPNTTFFEVFGVGDISWRVGKQTVTFDTDSSLLAALTLEGGGNTGALIRHAAAAVLNDCALEVDYALGHEAVIDAVQDVWGTPSQHGALKDILEGLNELGLEEDSDYVCAVLNDDYSIARYVTEYAVA